MGDKELSRKPPYRHNVRKHRRSGKDVNSYERGKGKKSSEEKAQKHAGKVVEAPYSSINIEIQYDDEGVEKLNLKTRRYDTALSRGRARSTFFTAIRIRTSGPEWKMFYLTFHTGFYPIFSSSLTLFSNW